MSTKDGVERLRRWWWFWKGEKAEKREPCRLRRLGSQLDTGMGEGSRLGPGAESLTHAQQTLTDKSRQPKSQVYCRERCWSRKWSCEEEEGRGELRGGESRGFVWVVVPGRSVCMSDSI